MSDIRARVEEVRRRVGAAAERAGRRPSDVTIVAVAKTHPADAILYAIDAGITDVGENRAQELRDKAEVLGEKVRWHFIGHLQTNKVKHVVGVAGLVHSLDRPGLADAISRRAAAAGIEQEVLVEVNVSGEPTKHGVGPEGAVALAVQASEMEGLRVRGLMTMPPYPDRPEDSRPFYARLADLRERLRAQLPAAAELSMGMTRDFEVTIEEGATILRIGEAIFGPRRA